MRIRLSLAKFLDSYGLIELLYAFLPILAGYTLGGLPFGLMYIIVLSVVAFYKTRRVWIYKPYLLLFAYIILHELVLSLTMPTLPPYHLNRTINLALSMLSPVFVVPALNYKRYFNALMVVAIISGLGLIYHFVLIQSGSLVTQLTIPFLPVEEETTRLMQELNRPKSFYAEPAAFATFMVIPLFYTLKEQKYTWSVAFVILLYLSTSTTAVVESAVIIVAYMMTSFSGKNKGRAILLVLAFFVVGFFILHSSLFEATFQKIEDTEVDENARLMNGLLVLPHVNAELLVFGVNSPNINDFVFENNLQSFMFYGSGYGTFLFVPTFWFMLIKYGVVGLFIYLLMYYGLYKRDKQILPYLLCLLASWFFQGLALGLMFTFQICSIAAFMDREGGIENEIKRVV